MKILLLLPIVIYLALILVNLNLVKDIDQINIFGATILELPVFLFNAIFVVGYAVIVFFIYDGLNAFLNYKIRKLDKEIVELKSNLYDNQEKLLSNIRKENENIIENIKKQNSDIIKTLDDKHNKNIELFKKENNTAIEKRQNEAEKILKKLNLLDESVFDKIKNLRN